MIPKTIYQLVSFFQPNYYIESLKLLNNDYEYKAFIISDIDELIVFIKNNKIDELNKSEEIITSKKFYISFFKYYLLYIKGGIFINNDIMPETNLDDLIKDKSFCSLKSSSNIISDNFICVEPKNRLIYSLLKFLNKLTNDEYDKNKNIIQTKLHNLYNHSRSVFNETMRYTFDNKYLLINPELNNDNTSYFYKNKHILTHYNNITPSKVPIQPNILKTPEDTIIGITFIMPKSALDLYSSGIKLNCLYFCELLYNIGYKVKLHRPKRKMRLNRIKK